jgi:hypothetical protein
MNAETQTPKPKAGRTKTDPAIVAVKKAYRSTPLFEVDELMKQQSRWMRKRTIAENKLADVRKRMDELLKELATPKMSS